MATISKDRLGGALRRLRENKGLEPAEVANRAGFGQAIITRTELGRQYPSLESLLAWLEALEVSPGQFIRSLEETHNSQPDVKIIHGFERFYHLLNSIIESGKPFYINGIESNLVAMAQVSTSENDMLTGTEMGNLAPKEKKRSKQRRVSLR